ncbi:MAG: Holliday junction resolvase-like protein [Candidatus Doudnabacteria bacterium Gr01-1014_77]|uniref:Putative pre-16S rRNA nuclease n=1 Tax=Candidatus Doudnabacteria bacterium Gr01-1014_77 TaxID=2017133 RepID=A0A554J9I1_9BACT|nr:MAG: Holliday junction resolvase-like protein [Candidatus Doudnabacteria bacterium Gr01-1014_77]
MSRILAIDYGEKRMGLALSDEEQKFAFEFEIWSPEQIFEDLPNLIKEKDVSKIVLGNPLNMSGEATKKTEEVMEFKKKLEALCGLEIELADERLSSKMAENISGHHKNIDSLAAQIFLQNYLNKQTN